MKIRPAQGDDAAEIAAIWNDVIDNTAFTFTTERKSPEQLTRDIAARGRAFQVATDGTRLLGFATYFQFRGGPGYAHTMEHSIQLRPDARGLGAGRALMAAIEAHARANGVHSMWAGVSGENPSGVAFHAALGYAHIATLPQVGRKFDRWMDLVLMQKIL